MSRFSMKLTEAQLTALDTAGAFEEPLDADDETLAAALKDYGTLTTDDPDRLANIIGELSNGADDRGDRDGRNRDPDPFMRQAYRTDCQVFHRLAVRLRKAAHPEMRV